ncbi:TolC family protein [Undibacterium sp. CY18W]|uniref:TolC family protein n=1 Tax=Undibacterium hunanense TaxID=2762292 RepID=A0ABR6ZYZ9_9BURK|nr:TolC family protein [Undibacterium hunanense]MBC3921072.1 TolC family protein [Undibacterium hunanense]
MFSIFAAPYAAWPRVIRIAIVTGILTLSSFAVLAADIPLTLGQAQQLAVARSRQLIAQDFAITASHEMAVAAGQLPDPVLKAGIDNLPISGPDRGSLNSDFMTMRRIGVMQELTGSDRRQLRAARYDRAASKSLAEKANAIAAIQRDTAIAWLDSYYAERMAAIVAEQANQARLEIEVANSSYRAGRGSQADIFAARSALSMVDDRYSDIQRKVRTARIMLDRWTGLATELPLAGEPSIGSIRLDLTALDKSLTHHPQIAVLTRQTEIAEVDAKLAEANKKSDWTVEVAFQQRGPAYSNMVSVGISLPFQWDQKNRQDRELSSKLAMVEQAKAERDETLRAHVAETRTMIEEWQSGLERSSRYERELIPLAKERTQATLGAYRGGKSSLPDLLATRRNEIDVRLQALQLQADTARLWAQLNFLFPADEPGMHLDQASNKDMP